MKMLDLSEHNGWYRFRFGAGDDFFDVLDTLKLEVPIQERRYYPDQDHLWAVLKSAENRQTLIKLFANGAFCIRVLESSPRLPGL